MSMPTHAKHAFFGGRLSEIPLLSPCSEPIRLNSMLSSKLLMGGICGCYSRHFRVELPEHLDSLAIVGFFRYDASSGVIEWRASRCGQSEESP
jgi:hypothetical protein